MRHTENPKLSLKKEYERLHRQIAWVFCVQMRMGQKKKKMYESLSATKIFLKCYE